MRYYIAYGSNLDLEQMQYRCPTAKAIGTAVLRDHHLLFRGSKTGAYLTVEPKEGGKVPVAVFSVEPEDEKALDRYEGYPIFYYKKDLRLPVKPLDGKRSKKMDCFLYVMHEDRPLGCPSLRYVDVCRRGYDAFGFSHKYLADAVGESVAAYCQQNPLRVKTAKVKVVSKTNV